MSYRVIVPRRVQKQIANTRSTDYERIRDAVGALAAQPRPPGCRKLIDRDGWRIRVGDFRILYDIDDDNQTVVVFEVGHRGNVYR